MAPVVVCVGLTTFDLVQRVAALPGPNQKVAAEQQWYDVGGPAANAARVKNFLLLSKIYFFRLSICFTFV